MGGSVMREIKFRAWDKENEEMYDVAMIDVETGEVAYTDHPTGYNADALLEQVELMQYTGLKDKNGKEIYEGDIILRQDEVGRIEFSEDGSFLIRFPHHLARMNATWGPIEVIGNIYENPELLEV
jgi:hypothetical protein